MTPQEENKQLRILLWLNHGHDAALYGDDGEMQCHECYLDFKRQPVEEILSIFNRRALDCFQRTFADSRFAAVAVWNKLKEVET